MRRARRSHTESSTARLGHRKSHSEDRGFAGRIKQAITNPGSVKINVKGAFIVEDEEESPSPPNGTPMDGVHYERKDIRLPHHTAVVSHVAVDVCVFPQPNLNNPSPLPNPPIIAPALKGQSSQNILHEYNTSPSLGLHGTRANTLSRSEVP